MNNQLILKEDVSLFDKVRAFFKGLFSKKDKKVKEEVHVIENKKIEKEKAVKSVDRTDNNEKNKYLSYIESNPDVIEDLPDDRLDKLIRYYRRIIALKRVKLNKLRESKN